LPGRRKIKRIHVNQFVIRSNRRDGLNDAPLRVKTSTENACAHEVVVDGPSRVVYSPDRPLSCGARVWIETHACVTVLLDGGEQYQIP
jgi:hypothetical protein